MFRSAPQHVFCRHRPFLLDEPADFRFGVTPILTPNGRGSYTRPHLGLVYVATLRDDGLEKVKAGVTTLEEVIADMFQSAEASLATSKS